MYKILVIDDDVDLLEIVKLLLERSDFIVNTLSPISTIQSGINSFNPDLILLDVSLNGSDGRDLCKKLKQNKNTLTIPIIMFSADSGVEKSAYLAGADDFISKPFEVSEILRRINQLLLDNVSS
jgi:DNA-binding response OmpR family regulator